MTKGLYADIIINITHENVDRPYTYKVPENLREVVGPGSLVNVPFGKGNTIRKGVVLGLKEEASFEADKIKEIDSISLKDISLDDSLISLAVWIKKNYGGTLAAALKTVLPVKKKIEKVSEKMIVRIADPSKIEAEISLITGKRSLARLRLLTELLLEERIPKKIVSNKLHISDSTIKKLEKDSIISIEEIGKDMLLRDCLTGTALNLSDEQENVIKTIKDDLKKRDELIDNDKESGNNEDLSDPFVYLLHGITGSGKTEVYLGIVSEVIKRGEQAVVLIPEISLTYQTMMRFIKRFGNRVSIMNSSLSQGEKYECFEKARNGETDVVIGPRSALFVPFKKLGAIIIDEEHEGSYKSESVPKYHARETAIKIAKDRGAFVVLGSATPSIDSYYKALSGQYKLFELTKRLTGNQLPGVSIVDLREELRKGNRTIISQRLKELLEERLSRGEQSMLFINRRGMAGFISCRACGFVVKCPHCDVSLSLHRNGRLMCHYCGYETENVKLCPKCGSKYISGFKAGTEQVEETIQKMFPAARTIRMDADTTKEKGSFERIIEKFLDKEADILIGTQMIVKGHDFKNVTLVGVLAADMSLFEADYRASEKTFDLLTQAAGRAGRGEIAGDVIIQTYQPEHYAIVHAANQDYKGFYEEEAGFRDIMNYPPFGHMLSVLVAGKNEKEALKLSGMMCEALRKYFDSVVIGPAPSNLSKINDIYRFSFFVKNEDYEELVRIKDYLEENVNKIKKRAAQVYFDFDPQNMQ